MKKDNEDIITSLLGVEPIEVNSAVLSAQSRKRIYWTNIPHDRFPVSSPLVIEDILEDLIPPKFQLSEAELGYMSQGNDKWIMKGKCRLDHYTMHRDRKSPTLTANIHKGVPYNVLLDCVEVGHANINGHDFLKRVYSVGAKSPTLTAICGGNQERKIAVTDTLYRKLTPIECERLQTLPDNWTAGVSNSQRYKMIGNGWTVDVIAHIFKGQR
jgi:site-specific DNA-cytosine methylase